jgi:hypothetical protein
MGSRIGATLWLGTVLLSGGCATAEQWSEWYAHPTHFASDQHLVFSARNREGQPPWVTRADIESARQQNWWGEAVTVSPDQIFQN